jgi:hypothetical protein
MVRRIGSILRDAAAIAEVSCDIHAHPELCFEEQRTALHEAAAEARCTAALQTLLQSLVAGFFLLLLVRGIACSRAAGAPVRFALARQAL